MIDPIHEKNQINYKCCLEIVKHYYVLAGFGPKSSSIGLILKVIDSSEKVWLNLKLDKERTLEDHNNWKNQPCTQNIRHYKLTHFAGDSAQKCSLNDHPLSPISDTELQRGVESQREPAVILKLQEQAIWIQWTIAQRLAERSDSARSSLSSFTFQAISYVHIKNVNKNPSVQLWASNYHSSTEKKASYIDARMWQVSIARTSPEEPHLLL